ncbi:twin-arginine translocation pathway signal [Flavivirga aquatica]|uniref:Twin-arginine translocation pathway signal n=1 Tax=Flavivirga aquatica TaxID=1849968 RepID=A0A1E5TAP1_9FLAO|nr:DUF1501 domain-containing protein [Flavivirga aquatica]OEK08443.1 twin-arginine translocation pathway signal [Flavivirga aquatica]
MHKKNINNNLNNCNKEDHSNWDRRSFLKSIGIVAGGTIAFGNSMLAASLPSPLSIALNDSETDRVLVLIRLKGGNDGLNTIIPLNQYDTYANARPSLKIEQNKLFKLSNEYGMPNYTNKLERLWGEGQMKVIHGVGYNNSSLSHFRGSDIWASADRTGNTNSGWMGRYFDNEYPDYLFSPPEKPAAMQIGSSGNLMFEGQDANFGFSVADPNKLYEITRSGSLHDLNKIPDCTHGDKVKFLKIIANATFNYAGVIKEAFDNSTDFNDYPNNKLAKQLSMVSRLIKGNLGTKVYLVTLDGFDTHGNQLSRHSNLMSQFSDTISHFYEDLEAADWSDKVLSMSISEFGRRVKENGSSGTDHGAAAPIMLFGSGLEGNGFIGKHPDLSNLDSNGNLINTTDYRQVYASVMKDWLCVDKNVVNEALLGEDYDLLDLGFSCNNLNSNNPPTVVDELAGFNHSIIYTNNQPYLHILNPNEGHINISLYNVAGQRLAILKNEMFIEGKHIIDIKQAANTNLAAGHYFYRIVRNGGNQNYSKLLIIT